MWEALIAHLLLWGNCYVFIERTIGGSIMALWPLDPSRMTPKRENGLLVYEYRMTDSGEKVTYPYWNILHIAGLSFNGLVGYSVISLMRETVGLGLAQEEFESRFYSNGAHPGGVLESDQVLGDEATENLRKQFLSIYGGVSNRDKLLVLQQGLKFHSLTVPQKDSEFLASREFTVRDVARWFLIPPHMIGDLDRATWGNIEAQGIDFVVYTLRPWLIRIEQAMETRFRLDSNMEIRHVVEGLLRGDSAARSAFYHNAILDGWMNRNEARVLEDLNPEPGLDEFLEPSNEVPASADPKGKNGKDDQVSKEAVRAMAARLTPAQRREWAAELMEA
jgi:HK97 family phage portal protein